MKMTHLIEVCSDNTINNSLTVSTIHHHKRLKLEEEKEEGEEEEKHKTK